MLNTGLFIRYFLLTSILLGLFFFLSSFSGSINLDDDILKLTNKFRKSKGLSALSMRNDLNEVARKHSEDMAKGKRSFGHGGFEQRTKQIQKHYPSCTVAENVAYGSTTADQVVNMWKNSSGHRSNMLGDYNYIGIGTARDRRGVIYYTQIFVR